MSPELCPEWPYRAVGVHRLVVETGADHVKRCHRHSHGHTAHHAPRQHRRPAALPEPLREAPASALSNQKGEDGGWVAVGSGTFPAHLALADPVLGGGEGGELHGRAHGHTGHGARHPPPQPHHPVLLVDAPESAGDTLGKRGNWGKWEWCIPPGQNFPPLLAVGDTKPQLALERSQGVWILWIRYHSPTCLSHPLCSHSVIYSITMGPSGQTTALNSC